MEYSIIAPNQSIDENGVVFDVGSVYQYFQTITDTRKARGKRYELATIMLLMLFAKLSGEDKPSGIADWAQLRKMQLIKALNLKLNCMPHHSTYRRVMNDVINAPEIDQMVGAYLSSQQKKQPITIVIDGKTLRGTIDGDSSGVHLLAAYLPEEGIVLMQVEVAGKENEISAAPRLLERLDLRQTVVLGDAMHTQRKISANIVAQGGHYVWIVKKNHPRLREDIEKLFTPQTVRPGFGQIKTDFRSAWQYAASSHGRAEKRKITTSSMMSEYVEWPYLAQCFKLERERLNLKTNMLESEIVYGITSLPAEHCQPKQLLRFIRSYWQIENALHYRRDVTFREDATRMSNSNAAQIMAAFNNLVIGIFNQADFENHAHARRIFNAKSCNQLLDFCTTNLRL